MKKAILLLSLLAGAVVFCAFDLTSSESPFESTNGNPSFMQKKESRFNNPSFLEKDQKKGYEDLTSSDKSSILNAAPPEAGDGQKLTGEEGTEPPPEPPPPLPLGTDTASLLFLILLSVGYLMVKTNYIPYRNKRA